MEITAVDEQLVAVRRNQGHARHAAGGRGPNCAGARVRARVGGGDSADSVLGVVVDDYAADAGVGKGHDWAPVRGWAVVADDGTLVFVRLQQSAPTSPW